jgi:lysophospholipase L1-like esterase
MRVERSKRRLTGALAAVAAATLATSGLAATAGASTTPAYVALGDSYTSGPLILPISSTAPLDCLQSGVNYPHLVAAADGLSLSDESCSGATTSDMTTAQYSDQAPQLDALSSSTNVVTIGIGGNDDGLFLGALVTCSGIDLFDPLNIGSPCKAVEGNTYDNDVASDASTLGAAFARIHTLAPNAKAFVVGYPDILPQSGHCYGNIPLTTGDVAYLDRVEQTLNATLQREATANAATFVNTYTPSIGHDVCQPESNRWIEPPIPSTDAAPVHPNAKGEAADARDVEAALATAGIG